MPTYVDEAQALLPVDDERRRPGNVIRRQAEAMIDTVALDDRPIRVDEDRQHQPVSLPVGFDCFRTLADDHEHFGP
jgi:hypothetical protein